MTTDNEIENILSKFCKNGKIGFKENLTFYKQNKGVFLLNAV